MNDKVERRHEDQSLGVCIVVSGNSDNSDSDLNFILVKVKQAVQVEEKEPKENNQEDCDTRIGWTSFR